MTTKIKSRGLYTQRYFALPELQNASDLAREIRLSELVLFKYFSNNSKYYHSYKIKKKSGSFRIISSPFVELKAIQRWVLRNILDKLNTSPYAKGFIKGKKLIENAIPHTNKQYILNIDLKDFFDNIPASHVFSIFHALGYPPLLSYQLAKVCTKNGVLPQGAPTSPSLSNLVCSRLDYRIGKYCEKNALSYTRYADDLTISGNKLDIMKNAKHTILKIIEDEGFIINFGKLKLVGPRLKREVTGLVVNSVLGIGRVKLNEYRLRIFNLYKSNDPLAKAISDGIIAYVLSVDKPRADKLKILHDKLQSHP